MDMPTPCTECDDIVEFTNMKKIKKDGEEIFVCQDCATEHEEEGEEHECKECHQKCTCQYNPCICCNPDW
tara:strand:+ start:6778 stop:6987 length:210 start_codon:yes stop_codon:yes gene_type:complete